MDSINLSDNVCSIYVESCDSLIDKTSHVVVVVVDDDDDDDTTKGRNVMLMVKVVIISKQSFIINVNVNYNYYTHIDSGHNVIRRYAYASVSNVY